MANANSTGNHFEQVTRSDIENVMNITYEQSMGMAAIFKAIERLSNDATIKQLCSHGALQAELQGNDLDVLREKAVSAGVCHG